MGSSGGRECRNLSCVARVGDTDPNKTIWSLSRRRTMQDKGKNTIPLFEMVIFPQKKKFIRNF